MAIAAIVRSRARQRLYETEPNYEYAMRPVWDVHLKPLPIFGTSSDGASPAIGTTLTYIDVMPKVNKYSLFEGNSPTSHPFRSILPIANQWLALHPDYEIVNCESIAMPLRTKMNADPHERSMGPEAELDPGRISYQVPMYSDENIMIRFLRLWVRAKPQDSELDLCNSSKRAQRLNYLDLRPRKVPQDSESKSRKLHNPDKLQLQDHSRDHKFQSLDDLVDSLNQLIDMAQIPGTIISIETVPCAAAIDWQEVPVEQTTYLHDRRYILGLRVFYDEERTTHEDHIAIKDFVPKRLAGGGIFKKPLYETMSCVVDRAERWVAQNPEYSLLNGQSLELKYKSKNFATHQLAHTEQGDYMRIYRIVYLKPRDLYSAASRNRNHSGSDSDDDSSGRQSSYQPPPAPIYLASKLFVSPHEGDSRLSSVSEMMNRWIAENISSTDPGTTTRSDNNRFKGVRVLFAETIQTFTKIHYRSAADMERYIEGTFQTGRFGVRGADVNISLRLYYDEGYFKAAERDNTHLPSPTHSTLMGSLWNIFAGGGGGGSTLSLLPPPPPTIECPSYHTRERQNSLPDFIEEPENEQEAEDEEETLEVQQEEEGQAEPGEVDEAQGRGSLPCPGGGGGEAHLEDEAEAEKEDSPPGYEESVALSV